MTSPIRHTDDEARQLAQSLISDARFGALATRDPATSAPMVSRIGVVPGPDGLPLSLVSDLSQHSRALKSDPVCALMLGEPGETGDPLTWPRLSLQGTARFIRHGTPDHATLAAHYLTHQPKAKLYIGFADFSLLRFDISAAFLNGGFGKAFELTPQDLLP
ncbi:HugZ family protein [Puniceibacterium sp. IMCC21224]|uniref:HugZ family pyridoxamine 5'-phosphate oxidase n=1 Tax=Puniceibacterium sp. IMCC21224 TaxID=1618204 RepID=UPI00064E023F|nr:pyridoxamine 5'-phosphate oxidase family protein [Puniceibacterium sp. IMCC21224]KMK66368.1 Pyridoxamine 5'-phosphate oxidase [Puniceibacterium sp. IMCC21224]